MEVSKEFEAIESSFTDANAFVSDTCEANMLPFKTITQILLAFEEIYINVCHYAYLGMANRGNVGVMIEIDETNKKFILSISDQGTPFNPLAKEDPDINAKIEDRKIGGLGIFLTKQLMDEVIYNYDNNSNVITLIKSY